MDFTGYADRSVVLAVDLVNTHNPISGRDNLDDVDALAEFVKAHECEVVKRPSRAELELVKEIRAQLRAVFEADDERAAAARVNHVLSLCDARPHVTDHDGHWHLHFAPDEGTLSSRLGAQAAMGIATVIASDGFDRLQVCRAETCKDVFVDMSRNRSRRYCSPAVCGNRASVAAFRARQREGKAT